MLDSCEALKGYSTFVAKVRENLKTMDKKLAADKAVRDCISEGILADVLSEERAAVMLEAITTFDEKLYEEGLREEGREEMRAVVDAKNQEIDARD